MMNHEKMTLTLSRIEMCDIRMALLHIVNDTEEELNDENTTADRKKVLEGTLKKWTTLREKVIRQFNDQDGIEEVVEA